jgi:hypothetical protein
MRKKKSLLKKQADRSAVAAKCTPPIATAGEVFADGSTIELIGIPGGDPKLMLWDGRTETVGALVEHGGCRYEPARFDGTLLRELTLPMQCRPHGTTRELLADICKLAEDFVGLPEQFATLAGRFVLCDWLVEATQVAPALSIFGLDAIKSNRLLTLMHCLCRHALRLMDVTPAGLRSLPNRAGFTLLISQPTVSDQLVRMLNHSSRRDQKIPFRGGLLDLFGAQVIHADPVAFAESLSARSIRIPMVPGGPQLPDFDVDIQHLDRRRFPRAVARFSGAQICTRRAIFDTMRRGSFFPCAISPMRLRRRRRMMPPCKPASSTCSGTRIKKFETRTGPG